MCVLKAGAREIQLNAKLFEVKLEKVLMLIHGIKEIKKSFND